MLVALALTAGGFGVWWAKRGKDTAAEPQPAESVEDQVAVLVESEDWILRNTPQLTKLSRGVMNLQLPDVAGAALFSNQVSVIDLGEAPTTRSVPEKARLGVALDLWPIAKTARSEPLLASRLWKPLFERVSYFERAKFYFVRASFVDVERNEIEADVNFDGLARTIKGGLLHVQGKQQLVWRKPDGSGQDAWRIVEWRQRSFKTAQRDRSLFRDVVNFAIPVKQLSLVRESAHESMLVDLVTGKRPVPHRYFSPHAADRHPSVSVIDIDRDGYDDLYVMARWGRNLFFRNRGDGTFEEIAARLGLDIEDHCSSAIFADFDNDGDADLFLGRTLQPSMYLVNEDGRFVDRTKSLVSTELPYLVFSISAADYNGDGLMDVFFSTYAQETQNMSKPDPASQRWLGEFLPDDQAAELYRQRGNHEVLERPGPPNVLLVNRGGGKFDLAPESRQVAAYRQTTQGTWSDFDDDGDLDLYLSNDFSINTMFRNDGAAGFVDITTKATADIGFGMGVSWGDYDHDGRQDLYVTNMFSKAGQRITSQLESLDPRFASMSRGNSLFRNLPDGFQKVSGLKSPSLQVEKAGWSWGGQFVDIDNDGYLDIHALSGFYTAPKQFALPTDL